MNLLNRRLTDHAPRKLAADFLEQYLADGSYLRNNIDELAAIAASNDESRSREAAAAIFESLVEPLCDSFEPGSVGLYIRLIAQLIHRCRTMDDRLDQGLAAFGLMTEQDLLDRAERLRPGAPAPAASTSPPVLTNAYRSAGPHGIKRIIVLSRVTIGADIAVTSVIVERLKQKFPNAALTLVGGAKIREAFGGDPRLDFAELEYGRRATLMGRLSAWVELVSIVRGATTHLSPGDFLVVDPDSRLTQLGMLPVVPDS